MLLNSKLIVHISQVLNTEINQATSVSGGDISEAFKLVTSDGNYFLKINQGETAFEMFEAEKQGLHLIASTKTIATPKVFDVGQFNSYSYLILAYVESKSPSNLENKILGKQLAKLHQSSSEEFGLGTSNFIGSLSQQNFWHKDWTTFYYKNRLLPQLQLAEQKGMLNSAELPSEEKIVETLEAMFINTKPSLLHGDLWSGNYLIAKDGSPYLIDPAVYYGDAEVDIAMSKLFGGFGESFYQGYLEASGKQDFSKAKIEIYQLYYLLVHLNLFGKSYYNSVIRILKNYF